MRLSRSKSDVGKNFGQGPRIWRLIDELSLIRSHASLAYSSRADYT